MTNNSRCKAKTKKGKPCRAAATPGGLCYFHANPDKASELGRIGGRKNRHFETHNSTLLPNLDSIAAVRDTVARAIADLYNGRLHPRIASSLVPLLDLQMRAIESSNLAERLAKLERLNPPDAGDEE